MPAVVDKDHMRIAGAVRAALAEYDGARDLIEVGAYAPGSNPAIDEAIGLRPALEGFLCQELEEASDIVSAREAMERCGVLNATHLLGPGAGLASARAEAAGAARPGQPAPAQPQPAARPAGPMPSIFRNESPQ
jgi:flagellum-specific ATP synthase